MTKEQRIIFGVSDIAAVRVRCTSDNCQGEMIIGLNGINNRELRGGCPFCHAPWIADPRKSSPEADLIHAINLIRERSHQPRVSLLFELDDDGPESSDRRPAQGE